MEMLGFLILVVGVLVGVAFLTLIERKILGYIQIRKGPNKVGLIGLFQPISDGMKLFLKEQTFVKMSNFLVYYYSPVVGMGLALMMWVMYPMSEWVDLEFSVLLFLCLSSFCVFPIMLAGWSSNSKYSLLGSYRSVAQTISYEVSMILLVVGMIFSLGGMELVNWEVYSVFYVFPLFLVWGVICLAETNRAPFDFAEGESELVSGFNVEYSGGGFAMIFLAEYANIMFLSAVSGMLFLGGGELIFMSILLLSLIFIWVRGSFPRYRYDKLMMVAWLSLLPVVLNFIYFCLYTYYF
uniref:NADH-ubiquinone oxidoreductase chain 1 n=1 Tax=Mastigoproctus giganteus TaxID=58767 RepID=B1Q0G3_MASGI|nr:NADH dehydrogenase subunit 1 [Mastigoproctus giganteus]